MSVKKPEESLEDITQVILNQKRVVVLAHYNPDADAFGSSCGLTLGLRALGLDARVINESPVHSRYSFIPGTEEVRSEVPPFDSFDMLIACDCGDYARVGDRFKELLSAFPLKLNIDHHASNNYFGNHNLVWPKASSTSEMVYEILNLLEAKSNKTLINERVATALFAGLSADTGSFKYSCTSSKTLNVAQALVARGALPHKIAVALYSNDRIEAVRLQSEALLGADISFGGKVASVKVDQAMLKKYAATSEDTEALVERLRDIGGVEISILMRQDGELWKVSMRSKSDEYDVSRVAQKFGGGGHKAAAGFRWKRSITELDQHLKAELSQIFPQA